MTQVTLSGEETDEEYEAPSTMLYCFDCNEYVLRSRRSDHPHDIEGSKPHSSALADSDPEGPTPEKGSEPEKVGAKYRVRIHTSVEYVMDVYAWDEWEAKRRAGEKRSSAHKMDEFETHTETRELTEVYADDPAAEEHDLLP